MPINPIAATSAIRMRLVAAFPTTPILFPNVPFTPPLGRLWLKFSVLWGKSMLLTMQPTHSNENIGVIQIDVMAPQSQGTGEQERMAQDIRGLYNRQEFFSVRCDAASGLIAHREETWNDGIWWGATIRIPFSCIEELFPE